MFAVVFNRGELQKLTELTTGG